MAEIVEVPLSGRAGAGLVAIIDAADAPDILRFRWHALVDRTGKIYARRAWKSGGRGHTERMHRRIAGAAGLIDHINGNTLDNRRSNLREATQSQNHGNSPKCRGGSSRYKGVSKLGPRWVAHIKTAGQSRRLGVYDDEADAARAYDHAAREAWGEFARLNFPQPDERGCR